VIYFWQITGQNWLCGKKRCIPQQGNGTHGKQWELPTIKGLVRDEEESFFPNAHQQQTMLLKKSEIFNPLDDLLIPAYMSTKELIH